MKKITLKSPAKLNLYLKVLNKRPDGFHTLNTLFERIDLSDTISFESNKSGKIKIASSSNEIPVGPKNLIYQAVMLIKEDLGIDKGVNISIKKTIPIAAGLGGGSSNAATTLLGLNRLWKLGLKKAQLNRYARILGSDVPFFIEQTSWAKGTNRGDTICSVNIKTKLWHVLVVPRVRMYTWKVYGSLKLSLTKKGVSDTILIHNLKKGNRLEVGRLLINDLEAVVLRLCPKLKNLKERLKLLGSQGVMVSGSGPSVFGITETKKDAQKIASALSKRYARVFVVRTL